MATPSAPHAPSHLSPRKAPRQQRATVTRDAILEAAARILEAGGLGGFNTNRVAERAGISVGSLYQYYPHKSALLAALSVQAQDELVAQVEAVVRKTARQPLEVAVRQLVALAVTQQFERARLASALDYAERELGLGPTLRPQRQLLQAALQSCLARYRDQIDGDLRLVAIDLQAIVQAMVDSAAERGEPPTLALRRRIERAALGYLRAAATPVRQRPTSAPAAPPRARPPASARRPGPAPGLPR